MYGAKLFATKSEVYFDTEQNISANVYVDFLTEYDVPQLDDLQPDIVF